MSRVNLQVDGDGIIAASTSTAATSLAQSASTTKTLETLLLASNKLRQKSEAVVAAMEAVPRTKAIEHALVNQTPSLGK